jgi:hypothetical protein
MIQTEKPKVNAIYCHHLASAEEVYEGLKRYNQSLTSAWEKLKKARRIGIKFNQAFAPDDIVYHAGQFQELVSEKVARATLRLLREQTSAELFCVEISVFKRDRDPIPGATFPFLELLREFEVPFIDGNLPPHKVVPVPGGGQIFRQYAVPQDLVEADAFVDVQKMKNHIFTGVTLCLKNLFGLLPQEPYGRSRGYFHHLVRMPYMLADLGRIFNPTLNIIDGLVGQAEREWGGHPRIANTLIAGDQVTSTDACATYLMGHDPQGDWLTPPYHRDRNALLVAAEGGFGTVDLDQIDFQSEVEAPLNEFYAGQDDPQPRVISWRRTMSEQALYYRDHQKEFIDRYAGEYILLQQGQVRWHSQSSDFHGSRRDLSGDNPDQAMYFKYVDPDEAEGEHFEVYEHALAHLRSLQLA